MRARDASAKLRELVEQGATGELVACAADVEIHVYLQRGRVAWGTCSAQRFAFVRHQAIGRGDQQVRSYHRSGTVDISQNYWEDISDPALSANWDASCNGNISFTGFHPLPLDVGPRLETLVDDVKQECLHYVQQDEPTDGDGN